MRYLRLVELPAGNLQSQNSIWHRGFKMNGWQPIETAPDDQRPILGVHKNSGIQKVCWRRSAWDERYEYGARPERLWTPTHYMLLPEPPK